MNGGELNSHGRDIPFQTTLYFVPAMLHVCLVKYQRQLPRLLKMDFTYWKTEVGEKRAIFNS